MNFALILKILAMIPAVVKFLRGAISEIEFQLAAIRIRDGVDRAKEGPLEDRLEGGKKVEDNFNRHT